MAGLDLAKVVSRTEREPLGPKPSGRSAKATASRPPRNSTSSPYDFGVKSNIMRMLPRAAARSPSCRRRRPLRRSSTSSRTASSCDRAADRGGHPDLRHLPGPPDHGAGSGAKTFKMKFGHHGANHPVKDLDNGRVEHHQPEPRFRGRPRVAAREPAPHACEPVRRHAAGPGPHDKPAFCFQGHPEASPGPHDICIVRPLHRS
ncbi:carbamoyl-phosphate synthase small chain [Ditylenchus destructor]|nr:carbamoyl-phosphate synthase small chain [Ditylenchus destructor]